MKFTHALILSLCFFLASGIPESHAQNRPLENISNPTDLATSAAERAAPFLVEKGTAWINQRGCVSCHQIPAMLWSLHALESNTEELSGIELNSSEIAKWTQWSIDPVNFVKPERKKDIDVQATLAGNIDTIAALLLAIPKNDAADQAWRQMFIDALIAEQQEDGSWKACGQLPMQKRPKQETNAATTLWATLALLRSGARGFDQASAREFVDSTKAAASTEWYAIRALVAQELGDEDAPSYREQLLQHQRADGGWGWLIEQPSDALATGIALYALAEMGDVGSEPVSRAREFLLQSQNEAGFWAVAGTKSAAKGKPTATSNYWGTAWAVVGLLKSR